MCKCEYGRVRACVCWIFRWAGLSKKGRRDSGRGSKSAWKTVTLLSLVVSMIRRENVRNNPRKNLSRVGKTTANQRQTCM